MNFKLRRFESSDLEEVMRINRFCLPENYTSFFFLNLFQRFPETFLVALEKTDIVGYIMCRIETGISTSKFLGLSRKGHIISVAVLPLRQREGIGYALMREAMNGMVKSKARECYLEVRVSNTAAINLYKKMGFEISRTVKKYYADGDAAYVMSRKLPFVEL